MFHTLWIFEMVQVSNIRHYFYVARARLLNQMRVSRDKKGFLVQFMMTPVSLR